MVYFCLYGLIENTLDKVLSSKVTKVAFFPVELTSVGGAGNIIVMGDRGRYEPSLEYSHSDWKKSSSNDIYQADRARFDAEKVRGEAGILIEDRYSR